jgi:hypothetical protein
MPEEKRPLKVFLCHAHADRDAVRGLYTRLTKDGVDAWLDKEKLLPGQDWELEIRKAVREADVVVVCLSKQFNQAGFRQKEVRLALDTAMEKPEGEIFIIPARLEECDNLESLRKWHEVDLFEDDGYEMLMRALRARAEIIGITNNGLPNLEEVPLPAIVKTIVDGLNWDVADSSDIFHARLSDAFPGLRGVEKFDRKEAIDRLEVLLREPLFIELQNGAQKNPFWWLRGMSNLHIHKFERLEDNRILLDIKELCVDFIVAVREFANEKRNFVYLQAKPEKETGLYKYDEDWLQEYLNDRLEKNDGYFFYEEYAVWNGRLITRAEYDDDSAIIDGKLTKTSGAELRIRYLTPYNIVICGQDHVLNNSRIDEDVTKVLDDILLGNRSVKDLVAFIGGLPINARWRV